MGPRRYISGASVPRLISNDVDCFMFHAHFNGTKLLFDLGVHVSNESFQVRAE